MEELSRESEFISSKRNEVYIVSVRVQTPPYNTPHHIVSADARRRIERTVL